MKCSSCSHENREQAKFCEECARPLTAVRVCNHCWAELHPAAKFCDECATPTAASQKTPIERTPRSYTPKHLADKILTSRSALEGERKQVTVLFADVKGSMDLAEHVDPEEWHRILDRFFQILTEGIHRFEGTINQFTGDGVMALFGAPIGHEDHARRACYAVLHLKDELRRYSGELRLARGLNFSVRMGLNSGEVVVGKIGDDLRMDYTALGHTASLAARMEQIAESGKGYLTAHTAKLVEGLIQLQDLGKLTVKGVKEPLGVYELQGIGRLHTRIEVSRARGFSKFVGREREMAVLDDALERPAVLLFEDLHWFDRASDEYIENLVVEIAPGNRTLLLLNFRPEYHARWMQRSYHHQLPLLPLGPEAIEELFADLLGSDPSLRRAWSQQPCELYVQRA